MASLHQIYVTLLTADWSSLGLRSLTQNNPGQGSHVACYHGDKTLSKPTHLLEPKNSEFAQTKRKLTWVKTETGFVLQATVHTLIFVCFLLFYYLFYYLCFFYFTF